ncbi:MAG: hypothetical protein OEU26_07005 [Candidatus Tectomicrobia bacterium]|nr:hypothetical protein [Candidatus Tectomicrobia bacterium]
MTTRGGYTLGRRISRSLVTALGLSCLLLGSIYAQEPQGFIPGTDKNILLAAVNTGGDPCAKDGICNAGACKSDPDCPKNMPTGGGSSSSDPLPDSADGIKDCTTKQTREMAEAIEWGANNWKAYEKALEDIRDWPVNIGHCLENRFKKNGKVVCESKDKGQCKGNNGWASALNKKCHMCPSFLDTVSKIPDPVSNRQACYFALVTHEWGHTCERGHKTLEIIDDEAFNFWKSKHSDVTISLSTCGMK